MGVYSLIFFSSYSDCTWALGVVKLMLFFYLNDMKLNCESFFQLLMRSCSAFWVIDDDCENTVTVTVVFRWASNTTIDEARGRGTYVVCNECHDRHMFEQMLQKRHPSARPTNLTHRLFNITHTHITLNESVLLTCWQNFSQFISGVTWHDKEDISIFSY